MTDSHHPKSAPGILVVDDDQLLLGLLRTVLLRQGFRVWTSPSGHDALDLYRSHQETIDLVLLDVCMPGLDGPRTLGELRRLHPPVRACFMSGHTGAYSPDSLLGMGALQLFEKPFQVFPLAEQLWRLVRAGARRSA